MTVCKEVTLRTRAKVLSSGLAVLAAHVMPVMLAMLVMGAEPVRSASQQAPAAATDEVSLGHSIPDLPPGVLSLDETVTADTLATLAGRVGWQRLAADSQMAPVRVTVTPVEAAGRRIGHQVQAAFVIRTPLETFQDDALAAETLGLQANTAGRMARPLTTDECTQAGLEAAGANASFAVLNLTLLNRVDLQGVVRAERRDGESGFELAWVFDHRFDRFPSLRAHSQRRTANALGETVREDPQPYAGAAGVVVVREVRGMAADPEESLLVVESRLAFAEPVAWFGGSNLLRAKIPLLTQEGVRTLRRRLATVPTSAAAGDADR